MYKAAIFTILSLIATTQAAEIQIPMENWLRVAPKESLVRMQLHGTKRLMSQASVATWSECDSQHLYDVASGVAKPNPPEVGSFVTLALDIVFNNDVNVNGNYVNVQFTPQGSTPEGAITLFAMDYPATQPGQYSAGDEFTDSISWPVPGFAPLGHYHVSVKTHGADKDKDVFSCLLADFDIFA
jgi:hypothetical protein